MVPRRWNAPPPRPPAAPRFPWMASSCCRRCSIPQKIICIGLNYADHAAETGATVGDEPVVFNKFPTCLRGPDDQIELPPESSEVDYEAELVVVIGAALGASPARRPATTSPATAAGTTSRPATGRRTSRASSGSSASRSTASPRWGPWLATRDEIADPENLPIELKLNGTVMQSSNTRQLIFKIDYLVSYLSHVCTLLPGDLIYTGTPSGVGAGRTPPVFLKPGDVTEVTIPGLGTLRNRVVASRRAASSSLPDELGTNLSGSNPLARLSAQHSRKTRRSGRSSTAARLSR